MKELPDIEERPVQDPGLGAEERADAALLPLWRKGGLPKAAKKPPDIIFLQMDLAEIEVF